MRAAMIAIFIAAWIVSFLLALVYVWVTVHAHNSLGLVWTAAVTSTLSTAFIAFRMRERAEGGEDE